MLWKHGTILVILALGACTTPPFSTPSVQVAGVPELTIGLVADTQIQNRQAWSARNLLRSRMGERVTDVTIRPPALDVTARDLLGAHLDMQRQRGVAAIFYLGDGSNQGCRSELSSRVSGGEGIFALLERFREESGIPVFFVLGNHDFLAAGNTEEPVTHAQLCGGTDNVASKQELIGLADTFNRASAAKPQWTYQSSVQSVGSARCAGPTGTSQSRRPSCYYAATLDFGSAARRYRFLLLDTNDYVDVTASSILTAPGQSLFTQDFEGTRGAMSFIDLEGATSQTTWLNTQGEQSLASGATPDVLVALTHYDVPSLRKKVIIPVSRQTQRIGDIFSKNGRKYYRDAPFVLSGHTHTRRTKRFSTGIVEDRKEVVRLEELNIGSTTDYPSLSAVARFGRNGARAAMSYEALTPSRESCDAILSELESTPFPNAVSGMARGREAVALSRTRRTAYRFLNATAAQAVFANIDAFVRGSSRRAVCLGLEGGAMEAKRPLKAPAL